MFSSDRLRAGFGAAIEGASPGLATADRLCHACVELLEVDGAAISLMLTESAQGTFGSSNELSRRLDEFQFTFGQGPCLDSVARGAPVLVNDLESPAESRWPAYAGAVLGAGVRAVYALPVAISTSYVGALDLFRISPGELSAPSFAGGLMAARLAALPVLDLLEGAVGGSGEPDAGGDHGWERLAGLERVEIYQATGMIMGGLGITSAEALMRLRAHAFAHGLTASEVAWQIVSRRLVLDADDPYPIFPGGGSGPSA